MEQLFSRLSRTDIFNVNGGRIREDNTIPAISDSDWEKNIPQNKNLFSERSRCLIGDEGTAALRESSLAVIGLGGVGSYAAEALARSGVGHITLVDRDQVEITNINRQIPALHSTLGLYKAEVMGQRLKDINPSLEVTVMPIEYTAQSAWTILWQEFDFVLDAIDSLAAKVHLILTCVHNNIPLLSSMGMANRMDPLQLKLDDIANTSICPLARKMRQELKKHQVYSGVEVVYSTETPLPVLYPGRSTLGSMIFVPASAGLLMANYAVRKIIARKG